MKNATHVSYRPTFHAKQFHMKMQRIYTNRISILRRKSQQDGMDPRQHAWAYYTMRMTARKDTKEADEAMSGDMIAPGPVQQSSIPSFRSGLHIACLVR
jgi:hypothetical protein